MATVEIIQTSFTRATCAGRLRSGGDAHGTVIHLIENPEGKPLYNLGAALCGREPKIMWSDWVPENGRTCPKCAKRAFDLGSKD